MQLTRLVLRLLSLLVPYAVRPRWREEWTAEMSHAPGWLLDGRIGV
jgi:hypothetical protein